MSLQAYQMLAQKVGMNERDQNAALSEYMANGGVNLDPAVTAWCAAVINASLEQAGVEGTGKLNARSYLDWGDPVDTPQRGDVAVFARGDPDGWQGHVGFYDSANEDGTVNILGGNQGDAVSIKPYSTDRLLGYRRAPGQPQPGVGGVNALGMPAPNVAPQGQALNALAPRDPAPQFEYANRLDASPFLNVHVRRG